MGERCRVIDAFDVEGQYNSDWQGPSALSGLEWGPPLGGFQRPRFAGFGLLALALNLPHSTAL